MRECANATTILPKGALTRANEDRGVSRNAPTKNRKLNRRYCPSIHRRGSIRLKGYDYTRAGAYFVTIVVQGRTLRFGNISGADVELNAAGRLASDAWEWIGIRYSYVTLDKYVVMPNHLHGIIVIADHVGRDELETGRKPLGRLIGAFKTVSTKQINLAYGTPGRRLWQRSFYEHVIRGNDELARAREYIVNNPLKWDLDQENPAVAHGGQT